MKRIKRSDMRNNEAEAMKVSGITIIVNLALSVLKLVAGIAANSGAMVSDAVHTASDVFSTVIVMAGIRFSNRQSDIDHQYGHERMECVASVILAVLLFVTGVGIGINGIELIVSLDYETLALPGRLALVAAVFSVIVKEWMYWYTRAAAKRVNSGAMMADAWHHRSDALSSVGAFIGILGARVGFPVLDPLASVIICIFILKAAFDIFRDAIDKMVDKSCDETIVNDMKSVVENLEGVRKIDLIKTRIFGSKTYVDIEISVDNKLSVEEAHNIAERVHERMERDFPLVKHCMVHVNPLP